MMDPLGSQMRTELAAASPTAIARIFAGLEANFSNGDWLASTNAYRRDCIARLKTDAAAGTLQGQDIGSYIAASVPLHSIDGWTFLARALTSYVNGNAHQAAHFAYYAELRAAMSILASQGIGVFNNQHFVVDQAGRCAPLSQSRGTHPFVWLALEHWSKSATAGERLLDIFIVANSTFKEWLSAPSGGGSIAGAIAQHWLQEWGLDLSEVEVDHDIRNLASYRPNQFADWHIDARACSGLLQDLWRLFEPSNSRFENLDRELLRIVVKRLMDGMGSGGARWLEEMLNGLPLGEPRRRMLTDFLTAHPQPHALLERVHKGLGRVDPAIHERVMARAALLLRVSSGFAAKLIDEAPFTIPGS